MKVIHLKTLKRLPKYTLWEWVGKSLDDAVAAYKERFGDTPRVLYRYEQDGAVSWFARPLKKRV
jgi:hypothetical protein